MRAGQRAVATRRVLVHGGHDLMSQLDDAWEWDGIAWLETTPADRPVERARHAIVYHERLRATLLLGGQLGGP